MAISGWNACTTKANVHIIGNIFLTAVRGFDGRDDRADVAALSDLPVFERGRLPGLPCQLDIVEHEPALLAQELQREGLRFALTRADDDHPRQRFDALGKVSSIEKRSGAHVVAGIAVA